MTLKTTIAGSIFALSTAFSGPAAGADTTDQDLILRPRLGDKVVEIDCAKDLPNGRPTLELVNRIEDAIGHGYDVNKTPASAEHAERLVDEFLRNHDMLNRGLIRPVAVECERRLENEL